MPRYKAIIAYDGTCFSGFQSQPQKRTVEQELNDTLTKINGHKKVKVYGSGRTDAKVHALGQVIHFDLEKKIPNERIRFALDTQLPEDISCKEVVQVEKQFHARYHVTGKTYEFRIDRAKARSPFKRHYTTYFPYPLQLDKIKEALELLKGTHDFTGFCAVGSSVEDKVRTITQADLFIDEKEEEIRFVFSGDGFLYKMVRIMVGTLLKIGNSDMPISQITKILETKERKYTGPTAHPEGLYLKEVHYDN